MASSPRIITQTGAVRHWSFEERPVSPLSILPSRAQASRDRNTSLAKPASRQAALAFRSLDPFRALREPDRRRRDGERPSRSEQRTLSKNQKQRLDRKSPIQVRIHLPPAGSPVHRRSDPRGILVSGPPATRTP